jgi:hypothetical protein
VHARSVLAGIRQHQLQLRPTARMLTCTGELVSWERHDSPAYFTKDSLFTGNVAKQVGRSPLSNSKTIAQG